jgi:hypothetical protein
MEIAPLGSLSSPQAKSNGRGMGPLLLASCSVSLYVTRASHVVQNRFLRRKGDQQGTLSSLGNSDHDAALQSCSRCLLCGVLWQATDTRQSSTTSFDSFAMESEVAASNASFEAVVCGSDEYVRRHAKLSSLISNGFFKFSQAERDARSVIRIEDIREDIEPTVYLRVSETGVLTLCSTKGEDIEYFCGLPPPALRIAQKHFKQAISEAVELSSVARSIQLAASSL